MAPHDHHTRAADARLRDDLLALADGLTRLGRQEEAGALRERLESWWVEHERWLEELDRGLAAHHEINNALVGVSGNVQLLLMGAACQQPGVRERLEVILREAGRIKAAAQPLRDLRAALDRGSGERRAA
jgi:nitrogen-specific signal transduction histidine kinase